MPYAPTGPVGKTLDVLAKLLGNTATVQTFLGVATQAAALKRILPGDGGFLAGLAGGWDGTTITAASPVLILEAQAPEYEQVSLTSWRVQHQIDLHLLHPVTAGDTAIDAYLRAWDQHGAIATALRSANPVGFVSNGVLTAQAPVVFGSTAPPELQGHYLSTLAVRYQKGQP